jgi:uncharacterized delta-60 repeat protein
VDPSEGYRIGVQTDGDLIVGGLEYQHLRVLITRLLPTGSIDTKFGSKGHVVVRMPGQIESEFGDVVVLPDDRILLAALRPDRAHYELERLTTNGGMDRTFSGDGMLELADPSGGRNHGGIAFAFDPGTWAKDHRVTFALSPTRHGVWAGALAGNGALAVKPRQLTADRGGMESVRAAAAADGSVYVTSEPDAGPFGNDVWHLNPAGAMDPAFDRGGLAHADAWSAPAAAAVDSAGHVVLLVAHGPTALAARSTWVVRLRSQAGAHAAVSIAPAVVVKGRALRCGTHPKSPCVSRHGAPVGFALHARSTGTLSQSARVFLAVYRATAKGTWAPITSTSWSRSSSAAFTTGTYVGPLRKLARGRYQLLIWRTAAADTARSAVAVRYLRVV